MTEPTPEPTEPTSEPDTPNADAPDTPDQAETEDRDGASAALKAERKARRDAERDARDARERAAHLERDAARRSIAQDLELTADQAALLAGDDEAAMREHAESLIAAFRPPADEVRRAPRERLRPGAVPTSDPDDHRDVADRVLKSW